MLAFAMTALAVVLLLATAMAIASIVLPQSAVEFLLAAYVIAFAEVVALMLVLSTVGKIQRGYLLAGMVAVGIASIAVWVKAGSPRPETSLRESLRVVRNPFVAVLAVVVAVAMAYTVALIVATPPNNWDSLTYHLARAAMWRQDGRVGYISDAYDERLNANPPNAEIAVTFALEFARNERTAGFIQFNAAIVCALGVVALARRMGLSGAESAVGGLLFLLLPIVVLQASTAQNDLVVASFLVCASVLLLHDSRGALALASIAIGLAIGTKVTAVYALPVLFALAFVASPRVARTRRMGTLVIGAVLGSYWFLVNLVETGRPLGIRPDSDLFTLFRPAESLFAALARGIDVLDLSGARGADVLIFLVLAAGLALATAIKGNERAFIAGPLVVSPILILTLSYVVWRVFVELHEFLGVPDRELPVTRWGTPTVASDSYSWFGPTAVLLVAGIGVAAVILVRRRRLPAVAIVLALAPLAWFTLLGLSLGYDPWQGRFFVFPVALSASLWGLILRTRAAATPIVAIASVTAVLSLVNSVEKPSGILLFDRDNPASTWTMDRWEIQSLVRSDSGALLRFLDERVPRTDSVALALGEDDFGFPAFGPNLGRSIALIPAESRADDVQADWLVANPRRARRISRTCWAPVFANDDGWRVFQAVSGGCPPP